MMTETDITTTVDQPSLPLDLPEYHGRKPIGQRTALNGAGTRIVREHTIGDRVVLVVEAKVKKAGHEDTDDGLVYVETLKVTDLFEVEAKAASRLLAAMRANARATADAGVRTPIPGAEDIGYTDASGVVLTPKEVAELRGDPVAAIIGDTAQVVVIYDDASRHLWPDEYPADTIRPSVGDTGADGSTVTSVVDGVTGEPVDDYAVDSIEDLPALADAAAADAIPDLPTPADFTFVDREIPALRDDLEDITDADHLRRLRSAEQQGRGRALKPRKGALDAIEARLDKVTGGVVLRLAK